MVNLYIISAHYYSLFFSQTFVLSFYLSIYHGKYPLSESIGWHAFASLIVHTGLTLAASSPQLGIFICQLSSQQQRRQLQSAFLSSLIYLESVS